MAKKGKMVFITDDYFWELLKTSRIKKEIAKCMFESVGIRMDHAKAAAAEDYFGEYIALTDEAWLHFSKINSLAELPDVMVDTANRSVIMRVI